MTEFILNNFSNHLLFNCNDKVFLLDTGAPSSVSNDRQIIFLDDNLSVHQNYLGFTVEKLSEFVGTKIDVLLGADTLSNYSTLINASKNKITFSKDKLELNGEQFSFETFMGIPIINFVFNGNHYRAFLDTGAALSYIKSSLVSGLISNGNKSDFYPGFGQFTTNTYLATIQVSNKSLNVVFGNLPSILETTLLMAGVDGIIGFDFFNSFEVLMNYIDEKIIIL